MNFFINNKNINIHININIILYSQILFLFFSCYFLNGCHTLDDMGLRNETVYPAAMPVQHAPPLKKNGAIYQSGYELSLFRDPIANRIGDIITVKLEEQTTGKKQADMKTNRGLSSNVTSDVVDPIKESKISQTFGKISQSRFFNTGAQFDFDGKGETNENNKLQGTISVTVTRVLSNNNLVIQGETWVTINQGREYIRLTGIVRSDDILPGNYISSQRIANARISYSGGGQVGNASRGGWLTQFIYKFFPL